MREDTPSSAYAAAEPGSEAAEKLVERARQRFHAACEAEKDQRIREQEDLLFQIPEEQWDANARKERMGGDVNGVVTPPRPMLSIDLLKQPRKLVKNQFSRARLGVNLHPVSEGADEELAEIKQALYRRIERDGQVDQALGWAFDRAVLCGRGWYRVVKRYDEDADPTGPGAWDQEIGFERILFQENVYVDPSAQKPDFSDARYIFCGAWMSEEEFRERWPAAEVGTTVNWTEAQGMAPDWIAAGSDRPVYVAEYWFKVIEREEIVNEGRKREREVVRVYCAKVNGLELLEPVYEWDGKYFPFIPVIAEELQPVDAERRWIGMVRNARDGQRFANFAASSIVEGMSLEPKAPWVMAEGQDEGHELEWIMSNLRNIPVLHYRMKTLEDKPAPPPARAQVDSSRMQLAMMAYQEAKGIVQSVTAFYDPSLGMSDRNESGRKVLALQQQGDAATSEYVDNIKLITKPYEARVVLDLMPYVYDRPGRVTSIVTGEDEAKTERIMLGKPFTTNDKGWPMAAKPGAPGVRTIDLRQGKMGVDIDVGRAFQTRLQEGGEMLGELLAKAPGLLELIGPTWLEFQDWPGSKEAAGILRKIRDIKYPGLDDSKQQNSPEQLQAQLQAAQGQIQQMGQQLQQAVQMIQTKQVEQQAKIQAEQIKAESDFAIARLKAATDITLARIKAGQQAVSDETEAAEERLALGIQIEADREARHEEMAHERAMGAAGGQSVKVSRERGSESGAEEGREVSDGMSDERSEQDRPEAGA